MKIILVILVKNLILIKNIFLINDKSANAFVINNSIYFTTGLIKVVNNEDTLKAIYLHEYGHIIKNHFQSKKLNFINIIIR